MQTLKATGLLILLFSGVTMHAQRVTPTLPTDVNDQTRYLFYLHGAIVQQMGEKNAVSEQYGRYEYRQIIDTLAKNGFMVISEVRPKDATIADYSKKISSLIDVLLRRGVPPSHITVVGASMGGHIAIEVARLQKNSNIRFAVLGVCSTWAINNLGDEKGQLCGSFLSIYEESDGPGSCNSLFQDLKCKSDFKEIKLTMGNAHGFLYKPYAEWVRPLAMWAKQ